MFSQENLYFVEYGYCKTEERFHILFMVRLICPTFVLLSSTLNLTIVSYSDIISLSIVYTLSTHPMNSLTLGE